MLSSKRLAVVIIAIALQALISVIVMFLNMPIRISDFSNNDVTTYRQQLSQIKATLPQNAVIGYAPIEKTAILPKEYYLAQYVLAPVIIKYSDREDIVLNKSGNTFFLKKNK